MDGSSIDGNTEGCPSDGCIGFELTSDLDFDTNGDGKITELDEYWNNGKGWESIGSVDNPFTGVFGGNGHEIRNLYINGGSDIALFGVSEGAQFTNIALKSFNISGGLEESRAGSLVSYARNTTINDCSASGSVSGSRAIGGLVSVINEGVISNCTLDVVVNSTERTAGGLAALALNSEIEHITVSGSIQSDGHTVGGVIAMALEKSQLSYLSYRGTVKGSASVGGITGAIEWSGLSNSYAYAEVSAREDSAGGLVGSIEDQSVIYQSQAACSVSGQSDVGGLVGYSNKGKIWNVTFTGDVTAEQNAGQLVGTMRGGQYNYTVTTGWPIESPSSNDYTSVGGLVGLDYSNVNFDSGKSLLELANESARADWERMNSDKPLENYIGLTLDSQKRIFPDMGKWSLTPEELTCPTAPDDHECWSGGVLYTGWDPSIWDFGNQQQLPKLKGMPDPSCKHLDQ
ncbi:hypothetical protein GCM10007392_01090 [Saccharospirillum salsuginis]|uniref:GLUG domain-containing protein n=1 Tax=Saccharospirillum salsuginis TaxID=418750 RepID=A0A918N6D2_9GAMM|nr:hypothetical protein GCM10007392_01090 [Saccharospirillum salsuginis]